MGQVAGRHRQSYKIVQDNMEKKEPRDSAKSFLMWKKRQEGSLYNSKKDGDCLLDGDDYKNIVYLSMISLAYVETDH